MWSDYDREIDWHYVFPGVWIVPIERCSMHETRGVDSTPAAALRRIVAGARVRSEHKYETRGGV